MLRESGKIESRDYDLAGALDAGTESGVDQGAMLVKFAAAVVADDAAALDNARGALVDAMGVEAVVSASLIAANFSMLDRVANGIGISLDAPILKGSADIREALGINAYPSAANSPI